LHKLGKLSHLEGPWIALPAILTGPEIAVFGTFSLLARSLHLRSYPPDDPDGEFGETKMTYSKLSQCAASVLAAIVASTLFISAAVGPVGQFI
jgi:hypothetical protein